MFSHIDCTSHINRSFGVWEIMYFIDFFDDSGTANKMISGLIGGGFKKSGPGFIALFIPKNVTQSIASPPTVRNVQFNHRGDESYCSEYYRRA